MTYYQRALETTRFYLTGTEFLSNQPKNSGVCINDLSRNSLSKILSQTIYENDTNILLSKRKENGGMTRKIASGTMLTLLIASMLTLLYNVSIARASPETLLYIDPPSIIDPTLTPGNTFTVDVMVSDVEFLYDWQANITFNPSVLRFANVTEGDFLAGQPEGSLFVKRVKTAWALFGATTLGMYAGVSGSGTLATVEFEVLALGESLIEFVLTGDHRELTYLDAQTSSVPPPNLFEIPFTAENGYFNNLAAVVSFTLDIKPDTLNLKSKGKWITARVGLSEAYSVDDVDVSSIRLNGTISAEPKPTAIYDHNKDRTADLMVRFYRAEVESYILDHISVGELAKARFMTVALAITGELTDGTSFQGSDTIKIVFTVPLKL